VDLFFFQNK